MNWVQFKDPFCYLWLPGTDVEYWFHKQEIAGSSIAILFLNNIIFVTEFAELSEKHLEKLDCSCLESTDTLLNGGMLMVSFISLFFFFQLSTQGSPSINPNSS